MISRKNTIHVALVVGFTAMSGLAAQSQQPQSDESGTRAKPTIVDQGPRGGRSDGGIGRGPAGSHEVFLRLPIIAVLDVDQDGVLSVKEVENATKALKTLDKNGDGRIDTREMMTPSGSRLGEEKAMVDRLMRRDKNGDRFLSYEEMPGPLGRIIERDDKNGDGKLSREEVSESVKALIEKRSGNRDSSNAQDQNPKQPTIEE